MRVLELSQLGDRGEALRGISDGEGDFVNI
jgi:hypothetical protein